LAGFLVPARPARTPDAPVPARMFARCVDPGILPLQLGVWQTWWQQEMPRAAAGLGSLRYCDKYQKSMTA
jgi:hypothetical protein